jgi:carotenoid 1,2-hydratase
VVANGYRWWYIDALSDDQRYGLTIIVFVGSVFSPYYASARRGGPADPESFCSINAILYNPRQKLWALTERGSGDLARSALRLDVGPSSIYRDGDAYTIDVDEITVPLPRRLKGRVKLIPSALQPDPVVLEPRGSHHWWPVAPVARAEVDFQQPGLRWSGVAYFDSNWGDEPLEQGFSDWHWSRAELDDGSVAILYGPNSRYSGPREWGWRCFPDGRREPLSTGVAQSLSSTAVWRVGRRTRGDADGETTVLRTLEDTPFYARSLLQTRLCGCDTLAFHESLDLNRFRQRWVQYLLPFRMPRFPRNK